ncbi:hypothetical protein ACFO1B_45980 [Dactylosporangium siamense]|uniref:DUF317 domain-containing protein n=1 Tax=Dactylosporangium siamense TaxID=685454 RepID=A0A919UBK8_9ACTN|nr:hypothetical protein [Dactylosporangium siamense]GIG45760.1 hypothetical protein Dsi01nite_038010 [Dactylosporangium siamense]
MEVQRHGGKLYEFASLHSSPDNAWEHELTGLTGAPGTGPCLSIVIPDAAPDDGPFTPMPARHAFVRAGGGQVPWPVLTEFVDLVRAAGDLVAEPVLTAADTALPLTLNAWEHDGRRYEVNQFHFADNGSWCYELHEVVPDSTANHYIDVQIPDTQPDGGPFVPAPSDRVTLTMHGDWTIPWPVFDRFLAAIRAAGDIVDP